jgi:hypothetical protein
MYLQLLPPSGLADVQTALKSQHTIHLDCRNRAHWSTDAADSRQHKYLVPGRRGSRVAEAIPSKIDGAGDRRGDQELPQWPEPLPHREKESHSSFVAVMALDL